MGDFRVTKVIGLFRVIRITNSCAVFVAAFMGGLLSMGDRIVSGTRQLLSENGQPLPRSAGFLTGDGGFPSANGELGAIALAAASMCFLAAFGYALNDYYDVRADVVNRPSRPIPSGTLSKKSVLGVAVLCVIVAAMFALRLRPGLQVWLVGMAGLVWLYSARIKRKGLAGNVLVSALAGSTLLVGGLSAGYLKPTFFPALLAFLSNLPREILKDVQDLEGDSLDGGRSVASAKGEGFALRLASVLVLVLVAVAFFPYATALYNRYYLAIVLLLDAFLIWIAVTLWGFSRGSGTAGEQRKLETPIRILKLTMLAGLLAIGLGSL
jgi:geranylgeranylglycerol-phosphate geranylgeranyltransferase